MDLIGEAIKRDAKTVLCGLAIAVVVGALVGALVTAGIALAVSTLHGAQPAPASKAPGPCKRGGGAP